ncbi:MAG: ribonuclease catalytic domain-containing protein, partial [bacterium]
MQKKKRDFKSNNKKFDKSKKPQKPLSKYTTRVFVPSSTFPTKVAREAKDIEIKALASIETEANNRRDFRKVLTFTIDPVDAKDYDDAISFQPLDGGYFEVGVHIADLSFYVKPGSALDEEAAKRATSIYFVDKVIPMLPEELSNDICSLKEDIDRLTYSAIFEINEQGEIRKEWFGRTVIHSDKRFSYDDVQATIETGKGLYNKEIKLLNKIALALRKKKEAAGAIAFNDDEIKFELDETGWPVRVYRKELKDANKLIEDFMLLANRKVAEFVSKINKNRDKTFIYRVHDTPDMEKVGALADFLRPLG